MRCLALADTLQREGAATRFISRHLPEHLEALLTERGHGFVRLATTLNPGDVDVLKHAHWLGTSQLSDARATSAALSDRTWDWLVVDHYALDSRWESAMRAHVSKIMAIDDLADRTHDCDLLLDQNLHFGMEERYRGLIPSKSASLFGPMYALLRPEFESLRRAARIRSAGVRRVLVSMGGVDATNQTEKAIHAVAGLASPPPS